MISGRPGYNYVININYRLIIKAGNVFIDRKGFYKTIAFVLGSFKKLLFFSGINFFFAYLLYIIIHNINVLLSLLFNAVIIFF